MGKISIRSSILTLPPEDFERWFTTTTLPGKWQDYYPRQTKPKTKAKRPKKVEEGGI